jgi:hypothetical protein
MTRKALPTPPGLLLAEDILGRMRELVRDTDLWDDSSINTNEMLGPGTSFAKLRLDKDVRKADRYNRFLDKHWQAIDRVKDDTTNFFVARNPAPQYITIRTFSRLAYVQALKDWAKALDGMPVELHEDRSWTWDHEHLTSTGNALHKHAYVLGVSLTADQPFKAAKWLKTAGQYVCSREDERADRCIFQLAEEAGLPSGTFHAVEYTRTGYILESETTAGAERVRDKLFTDCNVKLTPAKRHEFARLEVTLP